MQNDAQELKCSSDTLLYSGVQFLLSQRENRDGGPGQVCIKRIPRLGRWLFRSYGANAVPFQVHSSIAAKAELAIWSWR